jgi:hypothetical protein
MTVLAVSYLPILVSAYITGFVAPSMVALYAL